MATAQHFPGTKDGRGRNETGSGPPGPLLPARAGAAVIGADGLYRALSKAVWLAAGVFVLLWFLDAALFAFLLFTVVLILSVSLNPPVTWLEHRGVPRWAGALVVGIVITALLGLLGWLVVPRLLDQLSTLADALPGFIARLQERAARLLVDYPSVARRLTDTDAAARLLPLAQALAVRVGSLTLGAFGAAVSLIVVVSAVAYALVSPRPLLKGYLEAFPPTQRDRAARAFACGSGAAVGWLWSNAVVGAVEAAGAALFLTLIGVPGALVWGALAFFAELIPRLGTYLMSIPPILVALAVDPIKALWVMVFYIVIQSVAGDLIGPIVRAKSMAVHPVSVLFATVALGAAFGLLGAFIAVPVVGFIKAFYDEFYRVRLPGGVVEDRRVEEILTRQIG